MNPKLGANEPVVSYGCNGHVWSVISPFGHLIVKLVFLNEIHITLLIPKKKFLHDATQNIKDEQ